MENLYTPDSIRTVSGRYVNIFKPTKQMFDIFDIAHALSMQPRFGGHLPAFYSVAQHCVYVANLVDQPNKLAALLHDCSEAYLMDIPTPIKKRLINYKDIEHGLMHILADVFKFDYPLSEDVIQADKRVLEWEWDNIMLECNEDSECWSPIMAAEKFLKLYYELR